MSDDVYDDGEEGGDGDPKHGSLRLLSVVSDLQGVPYLIVELFVEGDGHATIFVLGPRDFTQVPVSVREEMGISAAFEDGGDQEGGEDWGNLKTGYTGLVVFSACQDEDGTWFMAVGEDDELNASSGDEDGARSEEVNLWVFAAEEKSPPEICAVMNRLVPSASTPAPEALFET